MLLSIENNFTPLGKIQYGTPQLSKSPIKLYRDIGNYSVKKMELSQLNMLKILNLADGTKDLLEISNNSKFKLIDYLDVVEKLLKTKYIKRK